MKRTQEIVLEFFVLEITVRPAANILGIHLNSVALFCRKIRQVFAFYLAQEATEAFMGKKEINQINFGGVRKCKQVEALLGK